MFNKIFGTVLKREGQLTKLSVYKTCSLGDVAIVNSKQLVTELASVPQITPLKKNYVPQHSVTKEFLQQCRKV